MSGKGEDRRDDGADKGSLTALALATQLGFAVAGPLLIFIALGVWADNQFGTGHWLFFAGLLLGVVSAGAALYQVATSVPTKPYTPPSKKPPAQGSTPGAGSDTHSWDDLDDEDRET